MFNRDIYNFMHTKKKTRLQDGSCSYSAWLGVCKVFVCFSCVCFSTRSVLPGMNCWTFGRTHHKIFYQILNIGRFTGHCSWRSCSSGQMLQDVQKGEASRYARETSLTQYRTARYICRISSWSDLIAMQNQRGNCAAAGHAFTSMRGGVHM